MNTQLKVGSKITVPLPASWKVSSSAPGVISVTVANGQAVATAHAPGSAILTLSPASDVNVSILFTVVPT